MSTPMVLLLQLQRAGVIEILDLQVLGLMAEVAGVDSETAVEVASSVRY